jgi:carbonic anhydrase
VAYARAQRVGQVLVIGHPRAGAEQVVAMNLADGSERVLRVAEILEHPEHVFRGGSHA